MPPKGRPRTRSTQEPVTSARDTPMPRIRQNPPPQVESRGNTSEVNMSAQTNQVPTGQATLIEQSLVQAFTKMTEVLEGAVGRQTKKTKDEALERFLKFQPPIFFGETDQDQKADLWMDQLEDIYAALQYTDEQKVNFAAFRLRGPARDWWLRVKEEWRRGGKTFEWAEFLKEFKKEYIP